MATRTTARQAEVAASITADDHDLWQIVRIGSTCPLCAVYEGRVYSKSGTNPDYPSLAMAFGKIDPEGPNGLENTYLNIHPNCLHSLIKYTTIGKSDEQIQKDKDFSSFEKNPATVDPRTKKQREAYRKKEANRRKYIEDLNQWRKYRAALGKDVPTFEKFREAKINGSDVYKNLEHRFRSLSQKTTEFNISDMANEYRSVRSDETFVFERLDRTKITTRKMVEYADDVYASVKGGVKPKAINRIHKNVEDAKRRLGLDDYNAPLVVVGDNELAHSTTMGAYDALSNTMYFSYLSKDPSDAVHELLHWKDAHEWPTKITNREEYRRFRREINEKHREKLEILGITEYNVDQISDYAVQAFKEGKWDEVYTEYRTVNL
jgi:hypothetical protein